MTKKELKKEEDFKRYKEFFDNHGKPLTNEEGETLPLDGCYQRDLDNSYKDPRKWSISVIILYKAGLRKAYFRHNCHAFDDYYEEYHNPKIHFYIDGGCPDLPIDM